jgi:hypothetical protein
LKSIKNLVTFHLGNTSIKSHMGKAVVFATEKTSVGVIIARLNRLVCGKVLNLIKLFKSEMYRQEKDACYPPDILNVFVGILRLNAQCIKRKQLPLVLD